MMFNPKTRRMGLIVLLSLIASQLLLMGGAAADNNAPIYLSFEKADPDGNFIWNGSVDGDISGALETQLVGARQTGRILHVEFDWIVDAGAESFTARLDGILDTQSGSVLMNGTVTSDGYLEGAQVLEEGQLVDPANSGFAGTIRVMPASAD